jgi:hypothetical protein
VKHLSYLKNVVFWDVTLCSRCNNGRFEGKYRHYHQGEKNQRARNNVSSISSNCSMRRTSVASYTADVVPSSLIPITLMLMAIHPTESSVITRATRCHILEDAILHSHRRETSNLTYFFVNGLDLNKVVKDIFTPLFPC